MRKFGSFFNNMNYPKYSILLVFLCCFFSYSTIIAQSINNVPVKNKAKFEPADGECLLFIGQDMHAIGGLEKYNSGYCDHFEIPAGITLYSNLSPGDESYGHTLRGNDGINQVDNWGAGNSCIQCYVDDSKFANSLIAIGYSFVNHEKQIARGKYDHLLKDLAKWIKALGERPVFLRLGYEFDGWEWNDYQRKHYLNVWKRIHSLFEEMEVNNVAFVWQSKGVGSDQKVLEEWYPGDELVDWCGYSYFGNPDEEMIAFARRHHKPVFIAEATPVAEKNGKFYNSRLPYPKVAEELWQNWFEPFFETVHSNADVVKAISYINIDWYSQPMWMNNPLFKKVDSRLQVNEKIAEKWKTEISSPRYLKPTPELWHRLYND